MDNAVLLVEINVPDMSGSREHGDNERGGEGCQMCG